MHTYQIYLQLHFFYSNAYDVKYHKKPITALLEEGYLYILGQMELLSNHVLAKRP
jgi:hypothetical protein